MNDTPKFEVIDNTGEPGVEIEVELEDALGDDIDIMDRVRLKVDVVSQEVFTSLWRQLSESIWVNNHDKGQWDEPGRPQRIYGDIGVILRHPDEGTEADVTRTCARIIYEIMNHSHMHSLQVVQELLEYSKQQQMPDEDATISE